MERGRGEVSGWQCLYLHRTNHCFLVSVCKRQKDGRGKLRTCQRCVRNCKSESIWTTLYRSLMKYILDVLNEQHVSRTELWRKKRKLSLEADQHKNNVQNTSQLGATTWKVMLGSALNAVADCPARRLPNKVSTSCLDGHHLRPEDLEIAAEFPETWSQVQLTCLYSARIGRPDLLWTVDYLADQSQSGTEHAVFDWHVSSAFSITLPTLLSRWKSSNGL